MDRFFGWRYAYGEEAMERDWNRRKIREEAIKAAEEAKLIRNLSYVGNSKKSSNQVRNPYILSKVSEYMHGRNPRTNHPEVKLYSGNRVKLNNHIEQHYGSFSTYSEQEMRDALSEPFIRKDFAKYMLSNVPYKYNELTEKLRTIPMLKTILFIAFDEEGEDPISQLVRTKPNPSKLAEGNVMMGLVMKFLEIFHPNENITSYYNKYHQSKRRGSPQFGELYLFAHEDMKKEMQNAKNRNNALSLVAKMFEEAETAAEASEVPIVSNSKCIGNRCAIMGGKRKTYRRKHVSRRTRRNC